LKDKVFVYIFILKFCEYGFIFFLVNYLLKQIMARAANVYFRTIPGVIALRINMVFALAMSRCFIVLKATRRAQLLVSIFQFYLLFVFLGKPRESAGLNLKTQTI
jgi:hypothetical protein